MSKVSSQTILNGISVLEIVSFDLEVFKFEYIQRQYTACWNHATAQSYHHTVAPSPEVCSWGWKFDVSNSIVALMGGSCKASCVNASQTESRLISVLLSVVLNSLTDETKRGELLLQSAPQSEAMFACLTSAISDLGALSQFPAFHLPSLLLHLSSVRLSLLLPCHTFLFTSHRLIPSHSHLHNRSLSHLYAPYVLFYFPRSLLLIAGPPPWSVESFFFPPPRSLYLHFLLLFFQIFISHIIH